MTVEVQALGRAMRGPATRPSMGTDRRHRGSAPASIDALAGELTEAGGTGSSRSSTVSPSDPGEEPDDGYQPGSSVQWCPG